MIRRRRTPINTAQVFVPTSRDHPRQHLPDHGALSRKPAIRPAADSAPARYPVVSWRACMLLRDWGSASICRICDSRGAHDAGARRCAQWRERKHRAATAARQTATAPQGRADAVAAQAGTLGNQFTGRSSTSDALSPGRRYRAGGRAVRQALANQARASIRPTRADRHFRSQRIARLDGPLPAPPRLG